MEEINLSGPQQLKMSRWHIINQLIIHSVPRASMLKIKYTLFGAWNLNKKKTNCKKTHLLLSFPEIVLILEIDNKKRRLLSLDN